MPLPNGCQLHVQQTESGARWHAWCDCGWNVKPEPGTKGQFTTRATQTEAMAHAIWHARKPIREQMKREREARRNGLSTTLKARSI